MPEEVQPAGTPSTTGDNMNTAPENPQPVPAPQPDGAYGIPQEEQAVTLKVPPAQQSAPETPETAETAPEAPAEPSPTEETPEPSEVPEEGAEGREESTGPEAVEDDTEDGPVVNNNPDNQTVTMPDGTVVYTRQHGLPMTNRELEQFELTHHGDQQRYAYVPGDKEYSPYSDPAVPNSHVAQMIEREIASFAERVMQDAKAVVSPTWNSFKGIFESELDQAIASGQDGNRVAL